MHILFVLDYFPPYIWGIETLFDDVIDFCVQKGYRVTVLTSHHDTKLPKIEKRKGVTIYRVGTNRITILWQAFLWWLQHKAIMRSIDHIHTSTFTASIPAWILSKIYKKSCTITIHEIYDRLRYHIKGKKALLYIWFERLLLKIKRDHIVTVSHSTKTMIQDIHHVSDTSLSVIYNQIDSNFWNISQVERDDITQLKKEHHLTESRIGLFVGRLGYEKWLPYLIEAMNDIIKEHPDFILIIIAPKTSHLYLSDTQDHIKLTRDHIINNNLHHHILWIDPVQDDKTLRLWMASADIGIVPSMSEWFCYTAVQMQAMWLSLIVSKVGALPEVLDSKKHSFIPYGKTVLLSDAITKRINEWTNGKNNNHNHKISINYESYCELFEKICKKNILSQR